jgi:hypothetical protein
MYYCHEKICNGHGERNADDAVAILDEKDTNEI